MADLKTAAEHYLEIMGRRFAVLAILETDDEANRYMETHEGAAVIAVIDGNVYLAEKSDMGVPA